MKVNESDKAKTDPALESRGRTIDIEGMKGEPCVDKVTGALKRVSNLKVGEVKVGRATLQSATTGDAKAACAAIKTAGFESKEAVGPVASTG